FRAVHPGEVLREELKERGITQKELARMMGVQPTHLNEFIKGKRNMTEELAMKLEAQLGISFSSWMNLHSGYVYDLERIRQRDEEEQKAVDYEEGCRALFNLNLLYKRLEIGAVSVAKRVKRLKELFGFDLLAAGELRAQVAGLYKHSEKVQVDEKNMLTWLLLNHLAIEQKGRCVGYVRGGATKAAAEIARMANEQRASVAEIARCLGSYGITYVEVERVEKAPVDAYSCLVDGAPVVSVTYRHNDLDKLVFDVLHELYHIDHHLGGETQAFITVDDVDYSSDPREKEANDFARTMLIPDAAWSGIMKAGCRSLSPHRVVKTIAEEAAKRGISPSIAVARYKHDANWYQTKAYRSPKIR
ncbi:MAG: HigA family addiction module antitoxin, partial [Rothia sp. (in: high G+C Gram-positive bacteria)]|uniref:HigA family addiction module antitoxin n=1 Tax=Rothia sp. (in: high G+C Gram-positive bacteria) TaxID=1885016 RepID=UPI0026DF2317